MEAGSCVWEEAIEASGRILNTFFLGAILVRLLVATGGHYSCGKGVDPEKGVKLGVTPLQCNCGGERQIFFALCKQKFCAFGVAIVVVDGRGGGSGRVVT